MGFRESILAGKKLVREAIQSGQYIPGSSGWTINRDGTAEFADLTIRSSDGSGATVEIENGKAIFTAANGWQIIVDPTNNLPVIYFKDGDGDEAGAINATGDNARSGLNVSSGPFADGVVPDYRWVTFMGEGTTTNSWQALRTRDSDTSVLNGGFLFLDRDTAQMAVIDTADPTVQTLLQIEKGVAIFDEARVFVSARPATQPAFRVDVADPGHTGFMVHVQREGSAKFTVDKDGNVGALGDLACFGSVFVNGVDQGRGLKDFAAITASAPTVTTTETVGITSGTTTFMNGRAYEVSVRAWVQSTIASDTVQTRLRKTNATGQQLFDTFRTALINGANTQSSIQYSTIIRNVSGAAIVAELAVTYFRASGTGNVLLGGNAVNPSWIRIKDIGPATDYPSTVALT
ncbi:hypothetical protein JGS39_24080 [Streptomyces sp. P01-B04]|uniref:hypothetical protein n=1 Tax=Streptomyces poriferorum TaxID=2798799 RepID=UPI001C5EFB18|nr:hypothetical protein [Streptomyces poriferorum]MBW5252041.1 hypothetical protein [Streptomyces poriferorum]MBW5260211.1 hypothetical protein [Streptomyces poriferorum]